MHHGEQVIAVRDRKRAELAGDTGVRRALDALLIEARMIRGGQEQKRTTQVCRRVLIDGVPSEKPRFLLISTAALRAWVRW